MGEALDLRETKTRLDAAMELVEHDRYVLGGLRDGMLKVVADSKPASGRRTRRSRPLAPLARRALFYQEPVAISSVVEAHDIEPAADWEMCWPAILYAPVGLPRTRPVGLFIVGSRKTHFYDHDTISYVSALAVTLTPAVLMLTGPLARLRPDEREVAHLLGEGLSILEIAEAVGAERREAEQLVSRILNKLSLRSPKEVARLLPDPSAAAGGLVL